MTPTAWLLLTVARGEEPAPRAPEPSPIARCADAAAGTEVEVCLQLATDHPDQVDGISAALRAHIARSGSPDRDLLLALLALIDDATGPDAAARIAALGDRRGVTALVDCAERRSGLVAEACVTATANFPGGTTHLARWLVEEDRPFALRDSAARALGAADRPDAADQLVDALRRPNLPPPLRKVILAVIRDAYPERTAELVGQVASDGRGWLAVGGAWGMGFAMGAAGHFGQSDLTALGWTTGAVGGGTAGWLYGRAWPMEAGDAAYVTTGGILGTGAGALLGAAWTREDGDAIYTGGLAGMALGYGFTAATRTSHPGSPGDGLEATGVAAASALGAEAVASLATPGPWSWETDGARRPDPLLLASGLGLAVGSVAGHVAAPRVDLSGQDAGVVLLGAALGTAAGALVPVGQAPRDQLPVLGLATGTLLGYGLAGPLDVPWDQQIAAGAGLAYGGAFGAGLGLLLDPDADPGLPQALGIGLGSAGLLTGAALARLDPEPVDDRDVVFVGLTTGWVAWQATGWALASPADSDARGWFLLAPAALGAAAAAASPVVDVPVPEAMATTSLGLWGAYVGGVSAELADGDVLVWSLVGSNLGLAGGALLLSPVIGAPPVVVGVADAGGVLGGSTGALVAAVATEDPDVILTASLVGAGVGLAGGAALGTAWKRGGTRDMARSPMRLPGRWGLRPDLGAGRAGLALEVSGW